LVSTESRKGTAKKNEIKEKKWWVRSERKESYWSEVYVWIISFCWTGPRVEKNEQVKDSYNTTATTTTTNNNNKNNNNNSNNNNNNKDKQT